MQVVNVFVIVDQPYTELNMHHVEYTCIHNSLFTSLINLNIRADRDLKY